MYTYCPGCRRKCLGFVTLCLDCEFALDELGQEGYRDGFHGALEWGMQHPLTCDTKTATKGFPDAPLHPKQTPLLPKGQETYALGYRNGFRRGMRCVKIRLGIYRMVLDEFLLDLGRRRAMLYCAAVIQRLPPKTLGWFDPNILRLIDQFF